MKKLMIAVAASLLFATPVLAAMDCSKDMKAAEDAAAKAPKDQEADDQARNGGLGRLLPGRGPGRIGGSFQFGPHENLPFRYFVVLAAYLARLHTTSAVPPIDAVGTTYLSSSPVIVADRFCRVPSQFGNIPCSISNTMA